MGSISAPTMTCCVWFATETPVTAPVRVTGIAAGVVPAVPPMTDTV